MLQSVLSREKIPEDYLKSFRKSFNPTQKLLSLQYRLLINDLPEASELIKKIEKTSDSSSIEFKLLQIFYLLEVQDYAKAEILLNQKLKKPDPIVSASLHWLKYELFKKQVKYSDCFQLLEAKISANQGFRALFERVFLLSELKRPSEAISLIESFNSSGKTSPLIDLCLPYMHENFEACLISTEDYLKLHPGSLNCLALKALSQIKLNDLSSALLTLDEALTLNNKFRSLWTLSGIAYFKLSLFSDSFLCFSKAISLKPDSASDWFNLSFLFSSKQPEVFKKIQKKIKSLKGLHIDQPTEFIFPSIDFSEFEKRSSEFVPAPFKDLNIVFVKPKPKKMKKLRGKYISEDRDINALAVVLEGFKKKSKGFNEVRVDSNRLPVKRKRKE